MKNIMKEIKSMMVQWLPLNDFLNQMENQNENGSRCRLLLPYIKGWMHHLYIKFG
jgi:hypothetical protein